MLKTALAGTTAITLAALSSPATTGAFTTISVPGGWATTPQAINDAGQATGTYVTIENNWV